MGIEGILILVGLVSLGGFVGGVVSSVFVHSKIAVLESHIKAVEAKAAADVKAVENKISAAGKAL